MNQQELEQRAFDPLCKVEARTMTGRASTLSFLSLATLFLFLFLAARAGAQTLVWSEEFNYTAAPDSDVWSYDLGDWGWGNAELQNYTSDSANAWVNGSNLVITAIRQGNSFTSARIKTLDKLTFKYGTVEARIKTPDLANGLWPAFWTLGNNFPSVGWPVCGEIDVMEMGIGGAIGAGLVNQRVGSHFHYDAGGYQNEGDSIDMASPINDTFVIYRMEWTPTEISTYINDQWISTFNIDPALYPLRSEFHEQHFFILNLAVGGTYTGIFDASGITAPFPAEYVIDYIRIFDNGHTVLGGSTQPPVPSTPYTGTPMAVPGTMEAEDYDNGGQGVAYSDTGATNEGGSYRTSEGVDIEVCSDTGGGYDVGWTAAGEWMKFTVDVATAGEYTILSRVARGIGGTGAFRIEVDDVDVTGTITVNDTGGWQSWVDKTSSVTLSEGEQVVKVVIEGGDLNLNYFRFTAVGGSNDPPVFAAVPVVETNAVEDAAYTGETLVGDATDPDGDPLSFSLVPGGPAWLSLATNGALSGTPGNADVGLNSWTVQVSDGTHSPVSATLEITVDNVNDAPVFTADPISMPNALEDSAYSDTIAGSATDVDAGAVLSYRLSPGGPEWLSVTTNGVLSGTPDNADVGPNSWTLQVSDGIDSDTATLEITVTPLVTGSNLLVNSGFESGMTGWEMNLSGGSASTSTDHVHGGTHSLVIDSIGAGGWSSPNASQTFSASPGDVFNVQGYMLNPAASPITGASFGLFKIEFLNSSGTPLDPASVDIGSAADAPFHGAESAPFLNAGSATDSWFYSEAQSEAPADTVEVRFVVLNVNQPGNPGPMYFDDIQAILIGDPVVVLPVSMSASMVSGNFQISFPTQDGVSYEVAYKNSLNDTNWTFIETVVGDGSTKSVSYETTTPARFYRVLTP